MGLHNSNWLGIVGTSEGRWVTLGNRWKSRGQPAGVRYESDALRGSMPRKPRLDDSKVEWIARPVLRALGRVMAASACIPVKSATHSG